MNKPPFLNTSPVVFPACNNGPCKQGRGICPSPEACHLAEAGSPQPTLLDCARALLRALLPGKAAR